MGVPRVTVLMAVYNGLPHLPEAIASVLAQRFRDFELVVVDDGSTDGSVACARSYDDPRVRVLENERNVGQTASLNRGLAVAQGEYVARLDQDDVCRPDRLEKQVAFLDARPDVAVVASWATVVDEAGRPTGLYGGVVDDYATFLGSLLIGKCPFVHSSVMVRRNVMLELGGYDEGLSGMQDYDLWARLALHRLGGALLREPLVTYRLHAGQQHAMRARSLERDYRVAHERMLARLSSPAHAGGLAALLTSDVHFWTEYPTRAGVGAAVRALEHSLDTARVTLRLSCDEIAAIALPLYRRLAGFARMGIARGHTQSLPLFVFALRRGGLAVLGSPSGILFPLLFMTSRILGGDVARRLGDASLRRAMRLGWTRRRPAA